MGYRDDPDAILTDLVRLVQEHFAGDGEAILRRCDRIADDLYRDGDELSEDAAFLIRATAHDLPPEILPMADGGERAWRLVHADGREWTDAEIESLEMDGDWVARAGLDPDCSPILLGRCCRWDYPDGDAADDMEVVWDD